jgi:hypothetical protein
VGLFREAKSMRIVDGQSIILIDFYVPAVTTHLEVKVEVIL